MPKYTCPQTTETLLTICSFCLFLKLPNVPKPVSLYQLEHYIFIYVVSVHNCGVLEVIEKLEFVFNDNFKTKTSVS